jgi:hypothetical protein
MLIILNAVSSVPVIGAGTRGWTRCSARDLSDSRRAGWTAPALGAAASYPPHPHAKAAQVGAHTPLLPLATPKITPPYLGRPPNRLKNA